MSLVVFLVFCSGLMVLASLNIRLREIIERAPNLKRPFIIMSLVRLIVVIAVSLLLTPILTPVQAPITTTVVAVYGTTPTIDGIISLGEWDDASTVTLSVTGDTVYVKQDGSNLYVAFDITDPTYDSRDKSIVFLDVDHLGGEKPQTDDLALGVSRDGSQGEKHGTGEYWPGPWSTPVGWTGACSSTVDGFQTEYSISYYKIGVTAGVEKTLGVMFGSYDYQAPYLRPNWPSESIRDFPDTWGDLIMPVRALPVGGLEAPINTLALLAPWILLALATSFGAILVAKRKRSLKTAKASRARFM